MESFRIDHETISLFQEALNMKQARFVSMIVLAASLVVTCAVAVETLILSCIALRKKR